MSRKKISIRRARPDDAAAIAALMDEPAVYANLMQMPYASEEAQRARIADSLLPGKTDCCSSPSATARSSARPACTRPAPRCAGATSS